MSDTDLSVSDFMVSHEHVIPKAEIQALSDDPDHEMKEKQHYLDLKKEFDDKLSMKQLYRVKQSTWEFQEDHIQKKDGTRNEAPEIHYYYTPLLCLLLRDLDGVKKIDVSYEVSSEFSSVPMNITIEDMISMEWESLKGKSILKLRDYAMKFGESDQFEILLLAMIDKFPNLYLCCSILDLDDPILIRRIMPWIKNNTYSFGESYVAEVIDELPDDIIHDLIDHLKGDFPEMVLSKLIDVAMNHKNNDLLIYFLKKYTKISINDLSIEKLRHLCDILKDIKHPDHEAVYAEEIGRMRSLKKRKMNHENDLTQTKSKFDVTWNEIGDEGLEAIAKALKVHKALLRIKEIQKKMSDLEHNINLDQEEIEQFFMSCPASVQDFIMKS